MIIQKTPDWEKLLHEEFAKPYFALLKKGVDEIYQHGLAFPAKEKMFRAFELCPPKDVRVVILGQDPYHTPGVADGLAFSTASLNPIPPSLRNIFKEIAEEYGVPIRTNPDLSDWAKQGVLLLNTSLTVDSGKANSHADIGWYEFTDAVVRTLSDQREHVVFMLWGNYAREKRVLIDRAKHLVLESPHPSPLSAYKGFFGNGHFRKANEYLRAHDRGEVSWY
ncbi:MAG: Uracil-DNA glycosylase [Parcubacteria group bacterium GW2011_GWA2_47_7]|nr:MAG: Uracil-DNA glycosylase [Parcubacteria group bacterium GW2011_GWA2_47_7]